MPSAADGGSTRVVLGHDHQRRHAHGMVEPGRALPVARQVAVPVDAAGEAGFRERIDEHLLFFRRQDRRARIVLGVVGGDHLRKGQIESWRGADARDRRLRRRVVAARHRLAHEGVKGLLDPAAEDPVGLARRDPGTARYTCCRRTACGTARSDRPARDR